jgi:hypothetical protein
MTTGMEFHLAQLQNHAVAINAMSRRRWLARPFYEYMSGGLVWTDETHASGEIINALRMLFRCRTQLLLRTTCNEWADYWNAAHEIVPKWVGFHPSRCTPSEKLCRLIAEGEARLESELAAFECEMDETAG